MARVQTSAGRELPLKDDDMVVGRHSDFSLKDEAAAGGNGRYFVQVADSPGGIAGPQALIELGIALGTMETILHERSINYKCAFGD